MWLIGLRASLSKRLPQRWSAETCLPAASRQALALMQEEEAGGGGAATVLCHGNRLTKAGAAFVNAEMILAGGKWDTFRMLTHPGTAILPAALAAAELTGCSGRLFLAGVAAGYEVMERMAAERHRPTGSGVGRTRGPLGTARAVQSCRSEFHRQPSGMGRGRSPRMVRALP